MKRAYSYIRFSDSRQQWGDSERRQTKLTEDYCARHNLVLDDKLQLQDSGKSAYDGTNVATGRLAAFLEEVEAQRVPKGSVLIVENLDRLTRNEFAKAIRLFTSILEYGITIVTLSPEREYSYEAVNRNIGLIMEAIMSLFLGHEESRKKAERVQEAWRKRLAKLDEEKLTARVPAWLTLNNDRKSFAKKPQAVKIVRQIFRWAIGGYGVHLITRKLNDLKNDNIGGRGDGWHVSYVRKILTSRAVLGEYQSYTGRGKKQKPFGPVVENYFPQIVSATDFYAAQAALKSRRRQLGSRGRYVRNLFTGLLHDARDGGPMTITTKAKNALGPKSTINEKIVSANAARGMAGTVYISFPYDLFEDAIRSFLVEVKASDILPVQEVGGEEERVKCLSGELEDLRHKIGVLKEKIRQHKDIDSYLDILAGFEREQRQKLAEIELAQEAKAIGTAETLGEVQSLVKLLPQAQGEQKETMRSRLKAKIRLIVTEMWACFVETTVPGSRGRPRKARVACVQMFFKGGASRMILFSTGKKIAAAVEGPPSLSADLDLRKDWRWFEKLVKEVKGPHKVPAGMEAWKWAEGL